MHKQKINKSQFYRDKNIIKTVKFESNKLAFTLVELIVVITILAILGTIAFISLQGYSINARDSTRISDLSTIKTSLELFQLDAGKYPIPTNGVEITYSGATVWNQGTFGETVYTNVDRLDKIPTDPLSNKEYTYSVSSNNIEYQIGGIVEGDTISYKKPLTPTYQGVGLEQIANAGTIEATAYVTGNYNGQISKSLSGSLCNVLAIPSIITNDTTVTDLQQIASNNSFVYGGYKNLPSSFKESKFKNDGGFPFEPNNLVAYSDTEFCTILKDYDNFEPRIQLLKGLQDSYTGTILSNNGEIKNILSLDINPSNPNNEVVTYSAKFVNNTLGGKIPLTNPNIINCNEGFVEQGGTCVADLCTGTLPTNAISNALSESLSNSWTYNKLNPGLCTFECDATYIWDGSSCISEVSPINGICGADNGQNLSESPINLCDAGNSANLVDNGEGNTYTWNCNGVNGGTNASCSATHSLPNDPYWNNVTLMMDFESSITTDSSLNNSIVQAVYNGTAINNTASISTSNKKFGNSSIYFPGKASLRVSPGTGLNFGTGDFTIEFWGYFPSQPNSNVWCYGNYYGENKFNFNIDNTSYGGLRKSSAGTTAVSNWINHDVVTGVWNHYAIQRKSGVYEMFVNGSLVGSNTPTVFSWNTACGFYIGSGDGTASTCAPNYPVAAGTYLDEFRITKGVARYTNNFSVPSNAYPHQ